MTAARLAASVTRVVVALTALAVAAGPARAAGNPYAAQRDAAVKRCEAISPKDYQTGLMLNPDGYRSYYTRSSCFQEAAVLYRDPALCDDVRRRWSLFSSSWGISERNCRKLVAEGQVRDSTELEQRKAAYVAAPVRLTAVRIERNGNGRDIDVLPSFTSGHAGSYQLRVEVITPAGAIAIDSTAYHLSGNDNIRAFVRQSDLRARLPGYVPGRSWHMKATMTYDAGYGGQAGKWSDAFIERFFPAVERTQAIEFDAVL